MPLRKKVAGIWIGVGENYRSEPSIDHISMLSEGTESSGEASHRESRGIMVTIKDLQHSQAAI